MGYLKENSLAILEGRYCVVWESLRFIRLENVFGGVSPHISQVS